MALERHALRNDSIAFHIMPRLDLFEHICECGFAPKEFWCYQDETTEGFLAELFTRQGGWDNPSKNCENMFLHGSSSLSLVCQSTRVHLIGLGQVGLQKAFTVSPYDICIGCWKI